MDTTEFTKIYIIHRSREGNSIDDGNGNLDSLKECLKTLRKVVKVGPVINNTIRGTWGYITTYVIRLMRQQADLNVLHDMYRFKTEDMYAFC